MSPTRLFHLPIYLLLQKPLHFFSHSSRYIHILANGNYLGSLPFSPLKHGLFIKYYTLQIKRQKKIDLRKCCFLFLIYLFIFGCVGSSFLCEGFLQLRRAGATLHRGARASHCCGLSLRSTSSRRAGSVVVAHGLSCSAACGIFPDQGSNPCPLHRQADSQPLRHQGSPGNVFKK